MKVKGREREICMSLKNKRRAASNLRDPLIHADVQQRLQRKRDGISQQGWINEPQTPFHAHSASFSFTVRLGDGVSERSIQRRFAARTAKLCKGWVQSLAEDSRVSLSTGTIRADLSCQTNLSPSQSRSLGARWPNDIIAPVRLT